MFYPLLFLNGRITDDVFLGGPNTIVRNPFFTNCSLFVHALLDVLSAALDAGLALSIITIFFAYAAFPSL